jgi:hypothetical protein
VSAVRPALLVPVGPLQLLLLLLVDEISALLLQLLQQRVVDLGVDDQIAVGRTA